MNGKCPVCGSDNAHIAIRNQFFVGRALKRNDRWHCPDCGEVKHDIYAVQDRENEQGGYIAIKYPHCSICGEPTPPDAMGWFGECPNCQFKMEVFKLSPEEIKAQKKDQK